MLQAQLLVSAGDLGRLKARKESLENRLKSSRTELTQVETHLSMSSDLASGEVADATKKCVLGHRAGVALLQTEFGYHALFRRPGDSFMAKSTFAPRVKNRVWYCPNVVQGV